MCRFAQLAVLCFSLAAAAQPTVPGLLDVMQARNFAMGGAYQSLGYGTEAIDGNPAALALYKRYSLELTGAYDVATQFGMGGVAVADSTTEVAAGVSYHFVSFGDADNRRTAHLTTLAFALPVTSFLALGLAARHQVIVGSDDTNSITMTVGATVHPFDWLTLGVAAHNLIDVRNAEVPRFFTLSVSSMLGYFTPVFDLRADFNEPVTRFAYSGGLEWIAGGAIPLRGGYEWDGINQRQYLSFGTGYFNEGSGLDLAYRHELNGSGRMLALTLKMQF